MGQNWNLGVQETISDWVEQSDLSWPPEFYERNYGKSKIKQACFMMWKLLKARCIAGWCAILSTTFGHPRDRMLKICCNRLSVLKHMGSTHRYTISMQFRFVLSIIVFSTVFVLNCWFLNVSRPPLLCLWAPGSWAQSFSWVHFSEELFLLWLRFPSSP